MGESTIEEIKVAKMGTLSFKNTDMDGKAFEQKSQKPFQAAMTFCPSTSVIVTVDATAAAAAVAGGALAAAPFVAFPSPFFPFWAFPPPLDPFPSPFSEPF